MVVEHAHGLRQRRGPNAKSSLHKAHLAPDAGLQAPGASLSLRRARMTSNPLILCLPSDQHYPKNKQDNAQQADTGDRINRDTKKAIVIEHQESSICPTTINARTVVAPSFGIMKMAVAM